MARSLTAQQRELAERLFSRLSVMYGTKFLDMWRGIDRAEVVQAWSEDLDGYSISQVAKAIEELKHTATFPPTLPEFLKLCDKAKAIEASNKPERFALPPAPVDPATTADARARCFATWKGLNPHVADRMPGLDRVMERFERTT